MSQPIAPNSQTIGSKSKTAKKVKLRPVFGAMTGPFQLTKQSCKDTWQHRKLLLLIVAVVQIPAVVLSLLTGGSSSSGTTGNPTMDAITNFAAVFMNVALLFVVFSWGKGGGVSSLKRAYYDSSKYVLRFILSSIIVILGLLPALFALIVYNVAALAGGSVSSSLGEQMVITGLCVLISLPTFWFLARFLLAPIAIVADNLDPIKSLARSRRLSLGRFWRVLGRLLLLGVMILIVALAVVAPGFLLTLLVPAAGGLAALYFEIVFALVILPFISVYLANLYQDLAKTTDQ